MDNNTNMQKGIAPIIIVCIVIALFGVGAGAWILMSSQKNSDNNNGGQKSTTKPLSESAADQNVIGQPGNMQEPAYPDDYILKASEVPAGFQLAPITNEARKLGFLSNPGFVSNRELYEEIYNNADASKIEKFYISMYIKPASPRQELGIFAVQYTRREDLESEMIKIHSAEDRMYLKNNRILVLVWSDGSVYASEVKQIVKILQERLNLRKL